LNAGACGGFKRDGAGVGDVFLTTGVANHDRRIPIPGFDAAHRIGKLETLDASAMANDLGHKTGVFATGNCLGKTDEDDEITTENDATVKDMEAAAIAWA
jgi:5'-methylthioadenosine nucleosidase